MAKVLIVSSNSAALKTIVIAIAFCLSTQSHGATLNIPLAASRVSFDPRLVLDQSSLWVSRQLNCQLVRNNGAEVINDAASSITYKSPTSIEFEIKRDLKFTNGSNVSAEDVVATFEFLKRSRKVHRNIFQWISRIESRSGNRVLFTLKKPLPHFLKTLAAPTQAIFPKNFLEKSENNPSAWDAPPGCGQYRIEKVETEDDGRTVLMLEPTNKEMPKVRFVLTGSAAIEDSDASKYDIIGLPIIGAAEAVEKNFKTIELFDPYQIYFAINSEHPRWQDRQRRCSLLRSIDTEELINQYKGTASKPNDWLPRGILGYSPGVNFGSTWRSAPSKHPIFTKADPFCLAILGVSIPKHYRTTYQNLFNSTAKDLRTEVIENPKAFGREFRKTRCDGIIFGLKSGYLEGYEYIQFLTEPDANVTAWQDSSLKSELASSQDQEDPAIRKDYYRRLIIRIEDACVARPIITIPKRRVFLRKSIAPPKIGRQALDTLFLGDIKL